MWDIAVPCSGIRRMVPIALGLFSSFCCQTDNLSTHQLSFDDITGYDFKRSINAKLMLDVFSIVVAVLWGKHEYTTKVFHTRHGLYFKLPAAVHDHFLWLRPTYIQRALPVLYCKSATPKINITEMLQVIKQLNCETYLPSGANAASAASAVCVCREKMQLAQVRGSNTGDNW